MSDAVCQFTVAPDDDDIRLDRWFKRHLPQVGFATISRWARTGQIRVDGKRVAPEDRVAAGQVVRVPPGGESAERAARVRRPLTPEQIEQARGMIIAETPAAFVLNKPPGLATQGGSGTFEHVDGLLDGLVESDQSRPKLVHRLDKDTSGVLLVAKTASSAGYFSKHFSGRTARKIYWALIVGVPSIEEGLIDLPLGKQPGSGGEKMQVDKEEGQSARTRYRVIDFAGSRAAWVELQPLTGRTHQLRVHMAAIGHPIVGDGKYGGQAAFLTGAVSRKMHLHARRLLIDGPDGRTIDATAELPEHFAATLAQLGFEENEGAWVPDDRPPPSKEIKKQVQKAHAKQIRKERRGERRSRDDAPERKPARGTVKKTGSKPSGKPGAKPFAKTGAKTFGKPPAKTAARTGAKPAGRPTRSAAKPGPGKPSGRPPRKS
jgi:23S rRNA pseudouridine955/2504/2580 synthase